MVRLRQAARQYGISVDTLRRWIDAGLIGRGGHGRVVFVSTADIERVIAPRYAAPATTVRAYPPAPAAEDWRRDPLWKGAL